MAEARRELGGPISGLPQGGGPALSVDESRVAFIARCRAKDLTAGTIAWYDQILRDLTRFLAAKNVKVVGQVLTIHLRDYLSHLRADHSSETNFRTWGALKCFFRFLARDGLLLTDPMLLVERPRRERRHIKPMSMAQVVSLLAVADVQYKAMLLLMVDSGLRISEILGLTMEQLVLSERVVTVFGKGRKERTVPIGASTAAAVLAYLSARGEGAELLFIGKAGNRLHPRTVQLRMKLYAKNAGIAGVRTSPHTLRHTFAIQYVKNGGDPFSLQAILGHSTLEMVRNYVNLANKDVCVQHGKFSPMDRLGQVAVQSTGAI